VVEELEEMGGGGGVGCCRSGGWVEKIVVEVVDWKRMMKREKVGLVDVVGDGGEEIRSPEMGAHPRRRWWPEVAAGCGGHQRRGGRRSEEK